MDWKPEQVAAAIEAHEAALSEVKPCPKCSGRGWHGSVGHHDPDWCDCGGFGVILTHDAESAMRAALDAALTKGKGE